MSTEQAPPTSGLGGRSAGTVAGLVVAVIALILGFVILRDLASGDGGGDVAPVTSTVPLAPVDPLPVPESTSTTVAPINKTGYKMVVANGSGVGGSAGQLTIALQGQGFIVEPATNSAADRREIEITTVYYLAGNETNASSVARTLGGVCIESMPTPVPTERATLGEASVLVLLGRDLAGKPLPATTEDVCITR